MLKMLLPSLASSYRKRLLFALSLCSLGRALLGNWGLADHYTGASQIALDNPEMAVAVCFNAHEDMEARGLAVRFERTRGQRPPSYLLALHESGPSGPDKVLAQAVGSVPEPGWLLAPLDGTPLIKGRSYCLVIRPDTLRGSRHPVDAPSAERHALLSVLTSEGKPRSFLQEGGTWKPAAWEPLWAVLGRGLRIQGLGWAELLELPIHGAGTPEEPSDDLWQAQVFHFPCGYKPTALRARLRRQGRPQAPLRYALLKHDYKAHKTSLLYEKILAGPDQIGETWNWFEVPIQDGPSLSPECHYIALKTTAGKAYGSGCKNCYEVSGLRVAAGLPLVQDLSWMGGAHRDRASSSRDGHGWLDDFEADLHLVLNGPPCLLNISQEPRLLPTPQSFLPIWTP